MHVLIADKFSAEGAEALRRAGHAVTEAFDLKGDALTAALREHAPGILLVRSTRVTAADLDASPTLELVVRAGAGVDTIDLEAASARGIYVANCPGKNAAAVAELAFGLLLALDRRLPDNVQRFREGQWDKGGFSKARGLKGRTLGLIGLGSIGREMVQRARGFGMPVVAWSRSLTDEAAAELGVRRAESPLDVAARADVVSLHVAATPDTKGLADAAFFDAMKPGAYLINTARASVVDEAALRRAMDEKGIRAATDVPAGEPQAKAGPFEHPDRAHPGLYVSHHIGASTDEAEEAIGREAVRVITTYADTGRVPNCVNLAEKTPATHLLTVRHRDRVGVLASVLGVVSEAGWNVHEMENLVFEGAEAAVARIRFDGTPDEARLEAIRRVDHVLAVGVIPL